MVPSIEIKSLHHFAYRCQDAEETRAFYEDLLGLPLVHIVRADNVPSTGEYCPYVHIFFQMRDGSYIAFFDLGDDEMSEPSPNTPRWVNHLALEVDSPERLPEWKAKLEAAGLEVIGVTDHKIIKSIYFFDPNGIRLELAARTAPEGKLEEIRREARAGVDAWSREKAALRVESTADA